VSAPRRIEFNKNEGMLLDEGGVVGIIEHNHLGLADCEECQQKDEAFVDHVLLLPRKIL